MGHMGKQHLKTTGIDDEDNFRFISQTVVSRRSTVRDNKKILHHIRISLSFVRDADHMESSCSSVR